jgi:hypothetical protein
MAAPLKPRALQVDTPFFLFMTLYCPSDILGQPQHQAYITQARKNIPMKQFTNGIH